MCFTQVHICTYPVIPYHSILVPYLSFQSLPYILHTYIPTCVHVYVPAAPIWRVHIQVRMCEQLSYTSADEQPRTVAHLCVGFTFMPAERDIWRALYKKAAAMVIAVELLPNLHP